MGQPYVIVHEKSPGQAEDWLRLATESHLAGKVKDADRQYGKALVLSPNHPIINQNWGILLAQTGNVVDALPVMQRANLFGPDVESTWINLLLVLIDIGRPEDALETGYRGFKRFPSFEMRQAMALAHCAAGIPGELPRLYREILDQVPDHYASGSNACFVQTLIDITPEDLKRQRAEFYKAHGFKGAKKPHDNDRNTDRPLRVGYVGGDFKKHSAPHVFGGVALFHDKAKIEPYFYSSLPVDKTQDSLTEKFEKAGMWRNLDGVDDEKAEAMIRADKIDVLVDLASHTCGGRLPLFTRKPAPVQVTAWGFAHGTGCPEIDYFFADPVLVPPQEREHFAEKIWDLPCAVTFAAPTCDLQVSSTLPFYINGYITFGAFARYEKMSNAYLAVCRNILKSVPDSRILFKDTMFKRSDPIKRVYAAMPGIHPSRLMFLPGTSHEEHMGTLSKVDAFLDPFPHSGGVGSMEQLYMGVPVVTLYGKQPSGRVTSSVLTQIGRTEWIAHSVSAYKDVAIGIAKDPASLAAARRTLHQEFNDSPVVEGYTEKVEAAYREMFVRWARPTPKLNSRRRNAKAAD